MRDVPLKICGWKSKRRDINCGVELYKSEATGTTKPVNGWAEMDRYYRREAMGATKPINGWAEMDRYYYRKAIGIIDEDSDDDD